jgi:N-acylneuraminate cytidylyltransferase
MPFWFIISFYIKAQKRSKKVNEEVAAIVPVREGSTRIKDKNFLPFGDEPTLIHNKINQLKRAGCFHHIYVSSDSQKARAIAGECGVEFLPRDSFYCESKPRWHEVIKHILQTVPGNPHVVWAMVTSPLFERYKEAVETYLGHLDTHDSLFGVKKIQEYFVDEKGKPLFYSFGPWHPYSNELKPLYAMNDTIFIARKSDQLEWQYWIGLKPYLFFGNHIESIDVNFPEDLEMALLAKKMQDGADGK